MGEDYASALRFGGTHLRRHKVGVGCEDVSGWWQMLRFRACGTRVVSIAVHPHRELELRGTYVRRKRSGENRSSADWNSVSPHRHRSGAAAARNQASTEQPFEQGMVASCPPFICLCVCSCHGLVGHCQARFSWRSDLTHPPLALANFSVCFFRLSSRASCRLSFRPLQPAISALEGCSCKKSMCLKL